MGNGAKTAAKLAHRMLPNPYERKAVQSDLDFSQLNFASGSPLQSCAGGSPSPVRGGSGVFLFHTATRCRPALDPP